MCLASFPFYVVCNNLLINLDILFHADPSLKPRLFILGYFCNSRPPEGDSNRLFLLFTILKCLSLSLALIITKRKKTTFLEILKLELILFFVIDLYAGISIILDNYLSTDLNVYFFSSAFLMGFSKVYFGNYTIALLFSGIVGVGLMRFLLMGWNVFYKIILWVFLSVCLSCLIFYLARFS